MIHTHKHTHKPQLHPEGSPDPSLYHEHPHEHPDGQVSTEPGHTHMSDSEDALSFTPIANGEEEGTASGAEGGRSP